MSLTPDAKVDCSQEFLDLLTRQEKAWVTGDFSEAKADWHPQGVLTAPGNRIPFEKLEQTIRDFCSEYGELVVTVPCVFASADGRKVALEWIWEITRLSDGARSRTEDAILVDLDENGKILTWREYFDTAGSVEDHHHQRG